MGFFIDVYRSSGALQKQKVESLMELSEAAQNYNLVLTPEKAKFIIDSTDSALKDNGRVEFGESIAFKITETFISSPGLHGSNFELEISKIIEIFFFIKGTVEDFFTDDEIIEAMLRVFEKGACYDTDFLLFWAEREMQNFSGKKNNEGYCFNLAFDMLIREEEDDDE